MRFYLWFRTFNYVGPAYSRELIVSWTHKYIFWKKETAEYSKYKNKCSSMKASSKKLCSTEKYLGVVLFGLNINNARIM